MVGTRAKRERWVTGRKNLEKGKKFALPFLLFHPLPSPSFSQLFTEISLYKQSAFTVEEANHSLISCVFLRKKAPWDNVETVNYFFLLLSGCGQGLWQLTGVLVMVSLFIYL